MHLPLKAHYNAISISAKSYNFNENKSEQQQHLCIQFYFVNLVFTQDQILMIVSHEVPSLINNSYWQCTVLVYVFSSAQTPVGEHSALLTTQQAKGEAVVSICCGWEGQTQAVQLNRSQTHTPGADGWTESPFGG